MAEEKAYRALCAQNDLKRMTENQNRNATSVPQVSYRERLVEFVQPLFVNIAEPSNDELFAWYCAHCAVIDQRVVELQLKHCNDDALRENINSVFERVALVRDLLTNRSNNVAAAIKRKLDVLLKQQDECSDAMQFAERVRLTQLDESDGIDAIAWNDVCVCFGALARARRQAHPVCAINILMPLIQGVSEAGIHSRAAGRIGAILR
jgi:hypothetical protein